MSALYQILGTGTKWVLKGNCHSFCVNKLLSTSNLPLSSRNTYIRNCYIWRNLSSQPHLTVKNVSSAESSHSGITVTENVSVHHTNSSSSDLIPPLLPNLNPQLTVDELTSVVNNESTSDEDLENKLLPRKAFDEVVIEKSPEISSFIDDMGPLPPVSFNLAAYVNMSKSLQELVKLGVDLYEIEEKSRSKFIQGLDFERDMKDHIQFLHDIGVPADELGNFLTKNPLIFQEDLENLRIKINYLEIKKFSAEAIARIVTKSPFHLSLETKTVDRRLGFLQKSFKLSGNEVRFLITKCPKLVPYKHDKLMEGIFTIKEVMGFSVPEMKQLLLMKPKLYMLDPKSLTKRFNVVHSVMGISHDHILHFPGILLSRDFRTEQRHKYLVKCGRVQYDPTKPNYVSLEDLATLPDGEFCRKCTKTSLLEFNEFLKTL